MKELNLELAKVLQQFKEGEIDLQDAMDNFQRIFSQFKKNNNISNKVIIETLESDFSNTIKKLYHSKGIQEDLKNNRLKYMNLRNEFGLGTCLG